MQEMDTIELNIPATHTYLNVVGACLAGILARVEGVDEHAVVSYNVQLAVHEIITNIVEHAYGQRAGGRVMIRVLLAAQPRRLVVELQDTGRAFDVSAIDPPELDTAQEGGYGLFLARALLDEVHYEPQTGNNRWRLTKYL